MSEGRSPLLAVRIVQAKDLAGSPQQDVFVRATLFGRPAQTTQQGERQKASSGELPRRRRKNRSGLKLTRSDRSVQRKSPTRPVALGAENFGANEVELLAEFKSKLKKNKEPVWGEIYNLSPQIPLAQASTFSLHARIFAHRRLHKSELIGEVIVPFPMLELAEGVEHVDWFTLSNEQEPALGKGGFGKIKIGILAVNFSTWRRSPVLPNRKAADTDAEDQAPRRSFSDELSKHRGHRAPALNAALEDSYRGSSLPVLGSAPAIRDALGSSHTPLVLGSAPTLSDVLGPRPASPLLNQEVSAISQPPASVHSVTDAERAEALNRCTQELGDAGECPQLQEVLPDLSNLAFSTWRKLVLLLRDRFPAHGESNPMAHSILTTLFRCYQKDLDAMKISAALLELGEPFLVALLGTIRCNENCFYGFISSYDLKRFILYRAEVGTYLIRAHHYEPCCFVIDCTADVTGSVNSTKVRLLPEGRLEVGKRSFHDFASVLAYYGSFWTKPFTVDLPRAPYFFGELDTQHAMDFLEDKDTGTFLIRFSSLEGCFAVTYVEGDAILKALLLSDASGFYIEGAPDPNERFSSSMELVEEYAQRGILVHALDRNAGHEPAGAEVGTALIPTPIVSLSQDSACEVYLNSEDVPIGASTSQEGDTSSEIYLNSQDAFGPTTHDTDSVIYHVGTPEDASPYSKTPGDLLLPASASASPCGMTLGDPEEQQGSSGPDAKTPSMETREDETYAKTPVGV